MVGEERVEFEPPTDVRRPGRARQIGVRVHCSGAARLREDPAGLGLALLVAAEIVGEAPQLVAVATRLDDGDEPDVTEATLVAGLGGVGDGEAFDRKSRAADHVLNWVVVALMESPLQE